MLLLAATAACVAGDMPEGLWLHTAVDGGVVGGDVVGGVAAGVGFETVPFAVHLNVPLNLRVVDLPPPAVDAASPAACRWLRCEEWLEANAVSAPALTKIVEGIRVLQPGDVFHAQAGGLYATLGHGQLVDGYTNASDWDRRHSGLYVESNLPWGRTVAQGLAGDFLAPQRLFGLRLSTSPMAIEGGADADADAGARFLSRMRLGFDFAGDVEAPVGHATDRNGDVVPGSARRFVGGAAADLTWPLLDDGGLQVAPYVGASSLSGVGGAGAFGGGAFAGLDASVDVAFVALRLGGRGFVDSVAHRSGLFGTLYDVDRRRYARAGGGFADDGVADLRSPGGVGGAGGVELVVVRALRAGVRAHLDPVPEASRAEVYGGVDALGVRVDARYQQRALGDLAFGDRTFVVVEVAWQVVPPFSLFGRWLHGPRFHDGVPVADDDVVVGASFDLVFTPSTR